MIDYILQPLTANKQVEVIKLRQQPKNIAVRLCRFIRPYLFNRKGFLSRRIYKNAFLAKLSEIQHDDSVLVFGIDTLKDIMMLDKEIVSVHKHVFMWNPISFKCPTLLSKIHFEHFMKAVRMKKYTFDPIDAVQYGFIQINQVYRLPDVLTCNSNSKLYSDIFTAMKDKGRSQTICLVLHLCKEANLSTDFYIVKDGKTVNRKELERFYAKEFLPYPDILQHVMRARCLLEILQEGQSGVTLRTMEALFLHKKLITNNPHIVDYDFYTPNNILVFDRSTTAQEISDFLDRPMTAVSQTIIDQHEIRNWIKTFM